MPQTLHPYYLQQMGIETWNIRKPQTQTIKLMVIGEALEANGRDDVAASLDARLP